MLFSRTLLALSICVSAVGASELRILKGDALSGDLVSVSDKEVVFNKGGQKVTVPVPQVLNIELGPAGRIPVGNKYIEIELVDGSLLRCLNFGIKGRQVELTMLLTGQTVKLPLASIANVLADAQDEKFRKEWQDRLHEYVAKKTRRDVLALLNGDVVNGLQGTINEGDAEGKTLEVALTLGNQVVKKNITMEKIHGLIFQRTPDPQAPPVLCKLSDSFQDLVMVSAVATTAAGLSVTTPSGAKLDYAFSQLAKLDYSKGKLTYLSDLKPLKEIRTSNAEAHIVLLGRDKNLDGHELISINRQVYAKGLSLQANTELEFDLDGEYREFTAQAGIDDRIKRPDADLTLLRIEGDGKVLKEMTFTRKNKERQAVPITLNIKDVQKLRIIVSSGDLTDVGKHVSLGDAKVSK